MSSPKVLTINAMQSQRLATNLTALIKKRGLSEAETAQALGLPSMTIRRLASGETTDPRISTLKLIADYFSVSVDALMDSPNETTLHCVEKNKPRFIPILDWHTATAMLSVNKLNLGSWEHWQPVTVGESYPLSDEAFALESRPSMSPRFPAGTVLIIDPTIKPIDGDTILVKMKEGGELSLRELVIDPPTWQLYPVVACSQVIPYEPESHTIAGVVILTMLYKRKIHNN
jgi:transcriptional regulator with XRE-family HTH domain